LKLKQRNLRPDQEETQQLQTELDHAREVQAQYREMFEKEKQQHNQTKMQKKLREQELVASKTTEKTLMKQSQVKLEKIVGLEGVNRSYKKLKKARDEAKIENDQKLKAMEHENNQAEKQRLEDKAKEDEMRGHLLKQITASKAHAAKASKCAAKAKEDAVSAKAGEARAEELANDLMEQSEGFNGNPAAAGEQEKLQEALEALEAKQVSMLSACAKKDQLRAKAAADEKKAFAELEAKMKATERKDRELVECLICLDQIDMNDTTTFMQVLPCEHCYCLRCCEDLVTNGNECPSCKKPVTGANQPAFSFPILITDESIQKTTELNLGFRDAIENTGGGAGAGAGTESGAGAGAGTNAGEVEDGGWTCRCTIHNIATDEACYECETRRPSTRGK
jgi:hypothetical protein